MAKKKHKKQKAGQQFLSPEQYMKQRARSLEIGACYISTDITDYGEGYIIVTRKHTGGRISIAMYLTDIYCIGVKDSMFRLRLEEYEFEDVLDNIPNLRECSYDEAHNWVYGAISWAEEAGIAPDKTFSVTKYMLKEDSDDVPLIEYEFGYEGKHWLIANSNLEASKYLPLLKKNLGEGNFEFTINDDFDKDVDWGANEEQKRLRHLDDSHILKQYGPNTKYTYQHPAYPDTLHLDGPKWLYRELQDTANEIALPEVLTMRILALPYDTVRHDLEQILLYHIGLTYKEIPNEYDPDGFTGIVANCIILLGEVGNCDSSLNVLLEVLRQSDDFIDYHFGDAGSDIVVPTLYLLGQNRLETLMNYIKEEGLNTFCKCHIFPAVAHIALVQPERRSEVIAWFREAVYFATKKLPKTQWFDSDLAGLMVANLIDIQAKELLSEIRDLFATNLVSLDVCGSFYDVSRMIGNPIYMGDSSKHITDIYKRFADMKKNWEH